MKFEDAVKAHVDWKSKLKAYLSAPNKSLNPTEVEKDNTCELGKWLRGEGTKYSSKKVYKDLLAEHTKFHKAAADIVRRADTGQKVLGETALGAKSEFSALSEKVVGLIMACGKECT